MYKLIRPLLFLGNAERMHMAVNALGRFVSETPLRGLLRSAYAFDDEKLHTRVFGIDFPNPVGLAAGFDKHARLINLMPVLGFGFTEVGTITGQPQPGNPRPRLFRLQRDDALVNRMGFNNIGSQAAAAQLAARCSGVIVGANIGRTKIVPNDKALEDYVQSFTALAPHVNFITVNVSSPNTPGLRDLQDAEPLRNLLHALTQINSKRAKPVTILLKIAPDLTESQLDQIIQIVRESRLAGIIATNTTIGRDNLLTASNRIEAIGSGGLSGKPLRQKATEVIRYIFRKTEGRIPIIGVGGIFSGRDAYEKIRAGASLVQVYTGLIYEGPGLVKKIKRELAALLARDGFVSVKDAVGADVK